MIHAEARLTLDQTFWMSAWPKPKTRSLAPSSCVIACSMKRWGLEPATTRLSVAATWTRLMPSVTT